MIHPELVDRGIVARLANEDIVSAPAAHQGVAAAASFHDVVQPVARHRVVGVIGGPQAGNVGDDRVDAVAGQVGALPARDEPGVTLEGRDG